MHVNQDKMATNKSPQKRRPGRPSSKKVGTTRKDLLEAAIELFGERGFAGASLSQIANLAGTDIGLTRYYFGSKETLWRAAIDHLADMLASELVQIVDREFASSTERMKAVIRWFIQISARHPQLSRIIVLDGNDEGTRGQYVTERLVGPFYALMDELIADAKSEGTIVDAEPRTIFFMITHGGSFPMALPVLTNKFPGGDISQPGNLEKHAEAIINLVFSGS